VLEAIAARQRPPLLPALPPPKLPPGDLAALLETAADAAAQRAAAAVLAADAEAAAIASATESLKTAEVKLTSVASALQSKLEQSLSAAPAELLSATTPTSGETPQPNWVEVQLDLVPTMTRNSGMERSLFVGRDQWVLHACPSIGEAPK